MSGSSSDDEYDPGAESVAVVSSRQQPTASSSSLAAAPTTFSSSLPLTTSPSLPVAVSALPSTTPTPAPKHLPSAAAEEEEDGGLRLRGIKGRVRCLCLNPSGSLLCVGGEDGQLCMWDFAQPLQSRRLAPTRTLTPFVNRVAGLQPIVAMHCSTDGGYVVACQDGDSPALISATTGKQLGYCAMGERGVVDVVRCKGHRAPVTCSSRHQSAAARFYTSSQDGTARMWDQSNYDRTSTYVVKHGSGQVTDTVVVQSVVGLRQHALFVTGGEDGCVQLWDTRAKYRPGGAVSSWDVYDMPVPGEPKGAAVFEKHVGGIVELDTALAVRRGSVVQFIDMRARSQPAAALTAVTGLPCITDTTELFATGPHSFMSGTSRAGFDHIVGGHVVEFSQADSSNSMRVRRAWRAGRVDEDVLCACADADGRIFAGLNTGDVVIRRDAVGGSSACSFDSWLATRPPRGDAVAVGERSVGQKSVRGADSTYDDAFIF